MGHFLPFYPLPSKNPPKNQNFTNMKKIARETIILHMCTKNHNHTRYGSWYMEWDFLIFWAISCTCTPLTTWKIKILKKWEKHLEMSSFYTCVPKITIIWCMLPDYMECDRHNFLSFWDICRPFTPPLNPKIKI